MRCHDAPDINQQMLRTIGIALLAVATSAANAQVRPDSARVDSSRTRLDDVVVRATPAPATVGSTSAVAVTMDSLHLPPGALFDQALRRMPFVLVRENSRGETEISMRGSESRQVAVLVDGIPITLGWDARADVSIIPVTGIEQLVMTRGLSSLLHGPNVLGGVVEAGIAEGGGSAPATASLRLRSSVDQFGAHSLSVAGSTPVRLGDGTLTMRGGGGYRSRPGLALSADVDDPGGDEDLRTNSDLDHRDAFAALRYRRNSGARVSITTTGFVAEHGVAPELHVAEPRLWRYPDQSRVLAVLSGATRPLVTPWGGGTLRASFGFDRGSTEIQSFETAEYVNVVGTESGEDRTLTSRVIAAHSLGESGELKAGATFADVSHDELIDGTDAAQYRQRLWSVGTEADWSIGRVGRLGAGVVVDAADTPETGGRPALGRLSDWGGRLGASVLVAGGGVNVHGSLTRRARFPALRELYSGSLGRFDPNPDLDPETLTALEGGATARWRGVDLQGVAFHHRLDDAVVRVTLPDGRFRRVNRDGIRTTGIEMLAGWSRKALSLNADLTVQDVRVFDRTASNTERRPEHQPEVKAGMEARLPLPLELRAIGTARFTGRQYCLHPDLGRMIALEESIGGDIAIERSWRTSRSGRTGGLFQVIRAALAMDNVSDAAIYDQCGLPRPGRTLRFGLEIG